MYSYTYAPAHTHLIIHIHIHASCTHKHSHNPHLLVITHSQRHTYPPTRCLRHTHTHGNTHWQYILIHSHIHTHAQSHTCLHPLTPPSRTAPLPPPVPSLKKSQGLPDGWDGRDRPPHPMPTTMAQSSSYSPAWSGCHAGRGWLPEPPCGRRTSRRHSLLQEKENR